MYLIKIGKKKTPAIDNLYAATCQEEKDFNPSFIKMKLLPQIKAIISNRIIGNNGLFLNYMAVSWRVRDLFF
jgi:hypothetical protein